MARSSNHIYLEPMILDKNHFKIFRKDSELGISRPDTIDIEVSDYDTEDIYACKVMPINERTRQDVSLHLILRHENIARAYFFFENPPKSFLIMEICDETLRTYVEQQIMYPNFRRMIARQIGKALLYLHQDALVIHMDIKPENILMKGHVVKLIDFGYSFKMNFPNMKCTDSCGGTVHYISSQRIRKLPIGPEEDTWAFACVLYFLITKEFAWTGSNLVNICRNIFHKPFNPPKDATLAETQILTNIFQKDPRLLYGSHQRKYLFRSNPFTKPIFNFLAIREALVSQPMCNRSEEVIIRWSDIWRIWWIKLAKPLGGFTTDEPSPPNIFFHRTQPKEPEKWVQVALSVEHNRQQNKQRKMLKPRVCTVVNSEMPASHQKELDSLLLNYNHVFSQHQTDIGKISIQHQIVTKDHPPISLRPYRRPILDEGLIRESSSPWAFPTVLV
ncbi:PLK4 [Cordylochernes scorpioides]|uniref:PLK4 n=1 Tax=Cordylochernes scorpioides TaxID=51811 RepID=A0ABY6K8P5_9ARAC|nr:PLK4 [Cordylochernes scorpioides]